MREAKPTLLNGLTVRTAGTMATRTLTLFPALVLAMAMARAAGAAPPGTAADSAMQKGRQIALEAERRDSGFKDSRADAEMIIHKRRGSETRRQLEILVREDGGKGDQSLVRFLSPADVWGTTLLTHAGSKGDDEQWLYLPALKRTKRIPSVNRSGAFMGSEFAYEDFAPRDPEDFLDRYLREEKMENQEAFVLERRPANPKSGYSRELAWLDKAEYRVLRIDYWDEKEKPLKTLVVKGYRKYPGGFWRADSMIMANLQTGDTTWLIWKNQRLGTGLSESEFSRGALENPR